MKQQNPSTPLPTGAVSIPPKVDPNDLHDVDGKKLLYKKEELPLVKQHLNSKEYFRKGDLAVREGPNAIFAKGARGFAAMRSNGVDYAIYKSKDEKTGPRNRELGHGNFGRVKLALNLNDGSWKAVKIQLVSGNNDLKDLITNEGKMNKEVGLGEGDVIRDKDLKGKNLDDFIEHLRANGLYDEALKLEEENDIYGYARVQEIVSIMPYIPGNKLTDIIAPRPPADNKSPIDYVKLAIDVMKAYQEQMQGKDTAGKMLPNRTAEIIHQDLKPDNILVDNLGRIRIIDLGFAKKAGEIGIIAGSPGRMAREVVNGTPANEKSDVFSLGIILSEVLGFTKVDDNGNYEVLNENEAAKRVPDEKKRIQLKALTLAMTDENPDKRPNVQECLAKLFKISPELAAQMSDTATSGNNSKGARQPAQPSGGQLIQPIARPAINVTPWTSARPSGNKVAGVAAVTDQIPVSARAAMNKKAEEIAKKVADKLTREISDHGGKPPPIHG